MDNSQLGLAWSRQLWQDFVCTYGASLFKYTHDSNDTFLEVFNAQFKCTLTTSLLASELPHFVRYHKRFYKYCVLQLCRHGRGVIYRAFERHVTGRSPFRNSHGSAYLDCARFLSRADVTTTIPSASATTFFAYSFQSFLQ